MSIRPVQPAHQLRLCVIGDFESIHTHSWVDYFVQRGHEVHGVSFYQPTREPPGVEMHALRPDGAARGASSGGAARLGRRLPINVQRLVNLARYRRAGIARTVHEIRPDVLHAHYLVEHGLYATSANYHPYVVSAWGSDVLMEATNSSVSRALARFAVKRTDQTTANNRYMAREMVLKLGIERAYVQHIVLGVSQRFLDGAGASVNIEPTDDPLTVLSTRSLDKTLYNIDSILRAMSRVLKQLPHAQLLLAGDGRFRPSLEQLARELKLGGAVRFAGALSEQELRQAMEKAHVFVSVPSSDATSVALLQAMGVGCFPIVSDLPSQQELVSNGEQGLRVRPRDDEGLATALVSALSDPERRRAAAERNRVFVENYGVLETNLSRMEAWYYRLAGRSQEYDPS
jgi:glycosyltransferase involved in cell wall biosynthesis